jgi:hypothetical protein
MKLPLWIALACVGCSGSAAHDMMSSPARSGDELFGPQLPQNPWTAPSDFATQHGDTGASDTSSLPGPGKGPVALSKLELLAACPSVLPLSSGLAFAVCTKLVNQTPAVYLFDPVAMTMLATRELRKGSLFGGIYPYLDERERLVAVDGTNDLLRIAASGANLTVEQTVQLGPALSAHCGSASCDTVVGLIPDYDGLDWFATGRGLIGTVTRDGKVSTLKLAAGEQLANSIASAPGGVALVSDRALYLMAADASGAPQVRVRLEYDRGSARKPGQLSWGSGTTPTFFGPTTGSEYVAILDNARPTMNLLVYQSDTGQPVCTLPVPAPAGDGTENSPIGAGRSVFIASTFGYVYAALPEDAGPSDPASAPFVGGMARIDVAQDAHSCAVVWSNAVRSLALPKLSVADGWIYTVEKPTTGDSLYTVIDAATGALVAQQALPGLGESMQLSPTLGAQRALFQGTITGIARIAPAAP